MQLVPDFSQAQRARRKSDLDEQGRDPDAMLDAGTELFYEMRYAPGGGEDQGDLP
jgi:hypothetical protein